MKNRSYKNIFYYANKQKLTEEDKEGLSLLISINPSLIDSQNEYLESPLHSATYNKNLEMIELLMKLGADVDPRDKILETPLYIAARYGYLDIAELLIKHGANVSSQNIKGWTPLHIAADYKHKNIVELLLENMADVNAQNVKKETPLHIALQTGSKEISCIIVKSGKCDFDLLKNTLVDNNFIDEYLLVSLLIQSYKQKPQKSKVESKGNLYDKTNYINQDIKSKNIDFELSEQELMGFCDNSIN